MTKQTIDSLMIPLLLPKNPLINLPLLELGDLLLKLVEIDLLALKLPDRAFIIRLEDGPLEKQAQAWRFRDADVVWAVALVDAGERRSAADDEGDHGDHLADLVHHEGLPVDFEGEPFGIVDDDGIRADFEGADDALGGRIFEGFLNSVVVKVAGADVV